MVGTNLAEISASFQQALIFAGQQCLCGGDTTSGLVFYLAKCLRESLSASAASRLRQHSSPGGSLLLQCLRHHRTAHSLPASYTSVSPTFQL